MMSGPNLKVGLWINFIIRNLVENQMCQTTIREVLLFQNIIFIQFIQILLSYGKILRPFRLSRFKTLVNLNLVNDINYIKEILCMSKNIQVRYEETI